MKISTYLKMSRIRRLLDVVHHLASNLVSLNQIHSQGYWWDSRPDSNILRRLDDSTLANLLDQHHQFVIEFYSWRPLWYLYYILCTNGINITHGVSANPLSPVFGNDTLSIVLVDNRFSKASTVLIISSTYLKDSSTSVLEKSNATTSYSLGRPRSEPT